MRVARALFIAAASAAATGDSAGCAKFSEAPATGDADGGHNDAAAPPADGAATPVDGAASCLPATGTVTTFAKIDGAVGALVSDGTNVVWTEAGGVIVRASRATCVRDV